jgi:hypothetical protein
MLLTVAILSFLTLSLLCAIAVVSACVMSGRAQRAAEGGSRPLQPVTDKRKAAPRRIPQLAGSAPK